MPVSDKFQDKVRFIKPTRPAIIDVVLNPVHVAQNKIRGIETSLMLDTNILINIERIIKDGNKWSNIKNAGLHRLIMFLQKCPPQSICLSVGNALAEMPPARAEISRQLYEYFLSVHLPNFVDAPNSDTQIFKGKDSDYGFRDLDKLHQKVLAIPYINFLYLNLMFYGVDDLPENKYIRYLDIIEEKVDLLCMTEMEISRYCFHSPRSLNSDIWKIIKKVRNNSIGWDLFKNKKITAKDIYKIAFNAASDINFLQCANATDLNGLDGVPQDTWIATCDQKLADFSEIFHHIGDRHEAGKIGAIATIPEHEDDKYWLITQTEFVVRNAKRAQYHAARDIDLESMIDVAIKAEQDILDVFG
ncbi:MAG: hypothetical protein V4732_18730 [Pseudomonadota bacterium]